MSTAPGGASYQKDMLSRARRAPNKSPTRRETLSGTRSRLTPDHERSPSSGRHSLSPTRTAQPVRLDRSVHGGGGARSPSSGRSGSSPPRINTGSGFSRRTAPPPPGPLPDGSLHIDAAAPHAHGGNLRPAQRRSTPRGGAPRGGTPRGGGGGGAGRPRGATLAAHMDKLGGDGGRSLSPSSSSPPAHTKVGFGGSLERHGSFLTAGGHPHTAHLRPTASQHEKHRDQPHNEQPPQASRRGTFWGYNPSNPVNASGWLNRDPVLVRCQVSVTVRIRPPRTRADAGKKKGEWEPESCKSLTLNDKENAVSVRPTGHNAGRSSNKVFKFDKAFGPRMSQTLVYRYTAAPLVANVLQGISACLIAYGQTGAGKT